MQYNNYTNYQMILVGYKGDIGASIPSLKRTRRLGFPRYLENQSDASSPSSKAEPDHSHTETPFATSDGSASGTLRTSIPGALITIRKGEVDTSEIISFMIMIALFWSLRNASEYMLFPFFFSDKYQEMQSNRKKGS